MFIDVNPRIKGVQIGDPEMKILNFPDDTTIFLLRDINYHTRINFKSHGKASSSKINFSKIQGLWAVKHKNRIEKPGQMVWPQLYIKIIWVHFVNSIPDNNNWGYNK